MADYYPPGYDSAQDGTGDWAYAPNGDRYWQPTGWHVGPDGYQDPSGNWSWPHAQGQSSRPYDGPHATSAQQTAAHPPSSPSPQPTQQPPAAQDPNANRSADDSAKAFLNSYLSQYGLSSLGDWAWQKYLNGEPIDQIMLEMRQTPEYKARFPYMDELSQKGRAITEQQAIDQERTFAQVFRVAGLNPDQYKDLINKDIGGEVSPSEMQARLQMYTQTVYQSDPEVRAQLKFLYGIGDNDILAYALDPNKLLPVLQNKFAAAQEASAGVLTGWGQLSSQEAEHLAMLGISPDQARQGFSALGMESELFNPLPGELDRTTISRAQQLNAQFEGNIDAQKAIQRKQSERIAQFQGGGSFATTNKGVVGVAPAQT